MNTCDLSDKKKLRDYFLNRLAPDETALVQHHLLQCPTCREQLKQMRDIVHGLTHGIISEEEMKSRKEERRHKVVLFLLKAGMAACLVPLAYTTYNLIVLEKKIHTLTTPPPHYHSGDSIRQRPWPDTTRIHEWTLDDFERDQYRRNKLK